jgi:hypothetical protein
MDQDFKDLDLVALTVDLPGDDLHRGQVGTVLDVYSDACEVEFSDRRNGHTIAMLAVPKEKLMLLQFESAQNASR